MLGIMLRNNVYSQTLKKLQEQFTFFEKIFNNVGHQIQKTHII